MPSTKDYLKIVLKTPINVKRQLLVDAGTGDRTVQRMRTELSRVRTRLQMRGVKVSPFKLWANVAPDPVTGQDLITYVRTSTEVPVQLEPSELEKLLADFAPDGAVHGA